MVPISDCSGTEVEERERLVSLGITEQSQLCNKVYDRLCFVLLTEKQGVGGWRDCNFQGSSRSFQK